ncbi:uncharacterized protein LOC129748433 [Uranotaenia lowii]|uniref:uncharacterized protein LOC129748433 n=1 Tax=Uranotaenia lowii TaxID=190385 RepID=UPI00247954A1|nr:uncharacterized protein LOC129748433 [Uranotaenia lowii]
MKVFIVVALLFCFSTAYAEVTKGQMKTILERAKICMTKLNIPFNDSIPERALYNIDVTEKDLPYIECILRQFGFFDENDNMVPDEVVDFLSQKYDRSKIKPLVEKCIKVQGTLMERVWKYYQCFYTEKTFDM